MKHSSLSTRLGRLAAPLTSAALIASLAPALAPSAALAGTVVASTTTSMAATTATDASNTFTALSDIVIRESTAGDIGNGKTIVLTLPTTFKFNSGASATAAAGNIGGGAPACAGMTLGSVSYPTAQTASVTVTAPSTAACDITLSGLEVQPTSKSLGGAANRTGSITNTGTSALANGGSLPNSGYGTLTETPGAANKLLFVTQPALGTPGVAFQTQPTVAVADAVGNRVFSDNGTVVALDFGTKPAAGASAALTCANATTVSGLATFSFCRIDTAAVGYTLTATSTPSYTSATSGLLDVINTLVFTTQPAGAKGGVAFTTQPVVELRAGSVKAVNTSGGSVTLAIATAPTGGGTLTCTPNPVTPVAGVATFAGCMLDKAGTYTLRASTGALSVISSSIAVTAGPATKLVFVQAPTAGVAGQAFATQPIVAITDAGGNVVGTGVTANVTLSIGTNPGSPAGVLTCTSTNTLATATTGNNAGQAAFTGCAISSAGVGYTLIATPTSIVCATNACAVSGSLTSATSAAFTVTAPPAQIALTASSRVITWGSTVYLSTHFAINGNAKTFTIQGSLDGINWTPLATRVTDASGNDMFAFRPATNLWYRAVFAGSGDLSSGMSPVTRVVVRQIAILRPTNSGHIRSVAAGTKVTFTVTVRPARPEVPKALVTFRIYRYVNGHWTVFTKRDAYINDAGQAQLTWKFSTRGRWYIRAIANPTTQNANSVWSPVEQYRVY